MWGHTSSAAMRGSPSLFHMDYKTESSRAVAHRNLVYKLSLVGQELVGAEGRRTLGGRSSSGSE